ncbi:SSI family serine proteinase inhibitor [Modestobacter sp. URMC 112]
MTRPSRAALLLLSLAVLAACAGGSSGAGDGAAAGSTQQAADDLQVEVDRGDGSPVERYSLTCGDPVAGDLPDAEAACAHLQGLDDPFAPLPADTMCTEQYGGPQTASVTGTWRGEPVDLSLSRTDGCRITQWDQLGPLLPGPVGVLPD